jgi:hypothetical protein
MRFLLVALTALLVTAAPAAADPVRLERTFAVTCPGTPTFQVVGTGNTGHVVGSTSIAVLLVGTRAVFEDGVLVEQATFTHPGKRTPLPEGCGALAQFVAPNGVTVRIEITNAGILLTPPR